jgi:hypothetical protein
VLSCCGIGKSGYRMGTTCSRDYAVGPACVVGLVGPCSLIDGVLTVSSTVRQRPDRHAGPHDPTSNRRSK